MIKFNIIICLFLCAISIKLIANEKKAEASKASNEITIDGKLIETDWQKAIPISDFLVKDPNEGAKPSEVTEIKFLYDEEQLYIGARMYRKEPDKIQSYISRRDNMGNSERIIISFDTYNNKTSSYSFAITATGVRADYFHSSDSEGDRDYNYNPVWTGKTNIDSLGWTAEIAIPFSQLRFSDSDEIIFGFNVNQYTPTSREDIYWVLIPKNQAGWSSHFGTLNGIKGIQNSSRIEFLPYISSGLDIHSHTNELNPFDQKHKGKINAGVDFKMGFGPNITLDATINPDFGQIEADPAVINLTEFETYFEEKRPFFIEGNKLFTNTGTEYYYSRRIGAAPSYRPNSDYCTNNMFSTILAAAKLTGRSNNGLSFGFMSSLVDKEFAKTYDRASDLKSRVAVSPYSLFNIFRASQEIDKQGSHFGFIVTSVNRDVNSEKLSDYYNKSAYTGGLDWNLFFDNKTYSSYGRIGFSMVNASEKRMISLQRTTTHLFQRPDAKHLSIDSTKEWLEGFLVKFGVKKISGRNWLWNVDYYCESPELNLNDFGRILHSDEHKVAGGLTYRENTPNKIFQQYYLNLYSSYNINFNGEYLQKSVGLYSSFTFLSKHSIYYEFAYMPKSYSDTRTRGGMMVAIAPQSNFNVGFSSDYSKPYQFSFDMYNNFNSMGLMYNYFEFSYQYSYNRWKFQVNSSVEYFLNPQQFIQSSAGGSSTTYGTRYIFGEIEQKTISTGLRVNYSFSPDMTLEFYASPFISNGKYISFGEIVSRNSYNLKTYGRDGATTIKKKLGSYIVEDGTDTFEINNSDFIYNSFRASAVFRWEYRAGCLFYAVWQINNNEHLSEFEKISGEQYLNGITAPGVNSFMIKLSYWLGKF